LAERYGYEGFIRLEHHQPCAAKMMRGDTFFREIQDNCWDPKRRIEEMDEADIDIQALSTVPAMFSYWAKGEDALDLSKLLNDHLASTMGMNPKRFVALGTLPMQSPDLAISELERVMKTLGFVGVQIGSHIEDWNLSAPELFPVFEAAAELGASVFVHPWDMPGGERMKKYWLPWLVGMPAETSQAICSIIFGGVLERLPNLKIAFAHGGGSFPGTIGRIEHGFNVRPDLVACDNDKNPREYLNKFYLDSLVHDKAALKGLIDLMGVNQIALGTDYPFPLGELEPGALIESMGLDDTAKERLLSGTAMEFLGLKTEAFL
jgi:aminocarboxymuconate-semialdehyde decarboxylase